MAGQGTDQRGVRVSGYSSSCGLGSEQAAQNLRIYLSEVQRTQVPVLGLLGCPPRLEAEKGFIGIAEQRETVRVGNTPGLETTV